MCTFKGGNKIEKEDWTDYYPNLLSDDKPVIKKKHLTDEELEKIIGG